MNCLCVYYDYDKQIYFWENLNFTIVRLKWLSAELKSVTINKRGAKISRIGRTVYRVFIDVCSRTYWSRVTLKYFEVKSPQKGTLFTITIG